MKRIYIIFYIMFLYCSSIVLSFEPELKWMKQGENVTTNDFVFSNDGKFIYVQYNIRSEGIDSYIIQKWDVETHKVVQDIPCNSECKNMIISNDGNYIASVEISGYDIKLINISKSDDIKISNFTAGSYYLPITTMSFSEDSKFIYTYSSSDKSIMTFDLNTYKKVDSIKLINPSYFKFSPDGKYAGIINKDSTISIWNIPVKNEIYNIKIPLGYYSLCGLNINSEYLIVNYIKTKNPDNIELYSMKTGKVVSKAKSSFEYPFSYILNDNKTILTITYPNSIVEKLDINSNIVSKTAINIAGLNIQGSPTENIFAGKDSLNHLSLYDLTTEKPIILLAKLSENFRISKKIIISPDNKSIFVAGLKSEDTLKRGQIIEYDFATGEKKNVYQISDNYISDMLFSKDGKILTVVDTNGKIDIISNFHEAEISKKTYDLKKNINAIAISEDNTKLIAGGFMTGFYYINLKTDSIKNDYTDPYSILDFEANIKTLTLNKKGDKLIVAGKNRTVFVFSYNPVSDEFYKTNDFKGDESKDPIKEGITQIAFSDDEKYLYCTSSDGYVHIFDAVNYTEKTKIKIYPDSLENYPTSAILTKDNKKIIIGDVFKNIGIYDVNSGEQLWIQKSNEFQYYRINSISLSDDEEYMSYCTDDGLIGLYRIDDKTSVDEATDASLFNIYPNPAGDYIVINFNAINPTLKRGVDEGFDIQIFDMLGVNVSPAGGGIKGGGKIDISNLSPGIYFLKIGNRVEKFVKM